MKLLQSDHAGRALSAIMPAHKYFVGVDSDGCVFDSMEAKQKRCFHPLIISVWDLAEIAQEVRETAEFVNLYSRHRGTNRFLALILTFDYLRRRKEIKKAQANIPTLAGLRDFCHDGGHLSNTRLQQVVEQKHDPELKQVLEWSLAVNKAIEKKAADTLPFPGTREGLSLAASQADIVCISQTPLEALQREWRQHKLDVNLKAIGGQEAGAKSEQVRLATAGRYAASNILIIGDAPGDLQAAQDNQACFFPIIPGQETLSWKQFNEEAFARFLNHAYMGAYQDRLIAKFKQALPDAPTWLHD